MSRTFLIFESVSKSVTILGPAHPFRGGIASFNERLAQEFSSQEWDTKIYTYTTQYPKILFPGKDQFSSDPKPSHLSIERTFSTVNPLSWLSIVNRLKKEKPNLLLSRYWLPYTGLSTSYIHKKLKQINGIHNIAIIDNLIPHQHMPGDRFLINNFLNSVDHFVTLSSSVQSDLLALKPTANCINLPHPLYDHYGDSIDRRTAANNLGLDQSYRYLLFFGFIKKYKGLDLLLEALDKEYMKANKLTLIIAGDVYGSDSIYDNIIKSRGLEDVIIFHKRYIANDQIANYFSISDLVVQPYRTATQSGISQIALYFNVPTIVTDVGSLSDFILNKRTGYLVPIDKQSIMDAIIYHFEEADLDSMHIEMQKHKTQFSWSHFTQQLISFSHNFDKTLTS